MKKTIRMKKYADFNGMYVSHTRFYIDYKHSHPCYSLLDRKLDSGKPVHVLGLMKVSQVRIITLTTVQIDSASRAIFLLPCNFFPNYTLIHAITSTNCN